jgi:anaerobic selenocysteine-containing dehydrogenase
VVDTADLCLRVRPGNDGALALAMIHVLFAEALYDERFVCDSTNEPFLIREDTQQLLTERDLAPAGHPETFVAWDNRRAAPVAYHPDRGYGQDGADPALTGTFSVTLADGTTVACRPVFARLQRGRKVSTTGEKTSSLNENTSSIANCHTRFSSAQKAQMAPMSVLSSRMVGLFHGCV